MDNHLTPNKIQRLMHLAQDKSFNLQRRQQTNNDDVQSSVSSNQMAFNKTGTNYESSSGILDLERVEGFGESGIDNISLSKSTAFNPGEMTGRSTGTEDIKEPLSSARAFEEYGRHSMALDSITSHMDKQTSEINDLMRHSIATNYSFHSKRDLTADEASLVMREAPLPVQHSTQANFQDSLLMSNSNMSVGAYFQNRCPDFGKILCNVDSPDRPSITDVSLIGPSDVAHSNPNNTYKMDTTLDRVPVRQPRIDKSQQQNVVTNLFPTKIQDVGIPSNLSAKPSLMDVSNMINKSSVPVKSYAQMAGTKPVNHSTNQKMFTAPKPTDILLRNLQSSLRLVSDDTECSTENSLSISKIADYLGKQSNVSVTDILQLNNQTKQVNRKQPLSELHMNVLENKKAKQDIFVTNLKDTKNIETASSSGTINTVISLDKLKINEEKEVPSVVVTRHSTDTQGTDSDDVKMHRIAPSHSPSSTSQSTLSTVQEAASFKSGDSPLHCSKEKWAEIISTPIKGFVGVSAAVSITITTLIDSWLTAKFEFDELPNEGRDLTIELPRQPLLLSPGKTEKFTLHITSNIELEQYLPFTMYLKDASVDGDVEQKGHLEVSIKMPTIQALSCDGVNKVTFPTIQEKSTLTKYFVLISDCCEDLQLELSIAEGDSMFVIKSVQEIMKNDVSKALMERHASTEDPQAKIKMKGLNKQLCRLSSGNAIKVTITFVAPKLLELELTEKMVNFKGSLNVNLIGINTILKKVNLIGSVGCATLELQPPSSKLHLTNETTTINLCNTGSITGVWAVKFRSNTSKDNQFPFKVSATKLEIRPESVKELSLIYTGPLDAVSEGTLILEDTATGNITKIDIVGGSDKPKSFPVKTNYNNMSWVRAGRKELSLKNSTNKKIQIRCQIVGEGFLIDSPGIEARGTFILSFGPFECRPLPIIFAPNSCMPHAAALHLVFDKNSDYSRKIKLHGCGSGEALRWSGVVTYGPTALVRAVSRAPLELTLYNKALSPAFVYAQVHFNLQYRFIAAESQLLGSRHIVNRRSKHSITLLVPWNKLERRLRGSDATALATVTVITGPEFTRRRILKIIKDESNGELDVTSLPDHLKVLVEPFEGEDSAMDAYLENFSETKACLNELIEGLQELTAQIDLPQDLGEENTILISDDTMLEHHTLCD
ncbi:uncharacterized protein LOC126771909 isoform X2 [Nymphalis io]|uniref:uncharacterized protein LOC126771909 isoform X2 n=1 Tax=Inachis io TaxID=171585 RepID=UPI00216A0B08|nr:uncharacterized protein LOC126771909 isoform X2 [Nymphalis io]